MKRRIRNLMLSLAALLVALILPVHAEQLDHIDLNHPGSLLFRIHTKEGKTVPGGTITIYRVADISSTPEGWEFVPNGDFAPAVTAERLNSSWNTLETHLSLAQWLQKYAIESRLKGETETVPEDGIVDFSTADHDIRLGLYLVTQQQNAPGYEGMPPFLISIPQALYSDAGTFEAYEYDVVATPKSDPNPLPENKIPEKPETPSTPKPERPDTSADTGILFYTGMLCIAGLFLFLLVRRPAK